jgi:response regulator RpfG family c-di-GMP phosphodiesterase
MLLVDHDECTAEVFHSALAHDRGVRLRMASGVSEAFEIATREHPELIATSLETLGPGAFELCRRLRAEPWAGALRFLLIMNPGPGELRFAAIDAGMDDALVRPVDPAAVYAQLQDAQKARRAWQQGQADRFEAGRLREALHHHVEQTSTLLGNLLDMSLPGAWARSSRVATMSLRLAARFGVSEALQRHLEVAARLHELGRIVSPGSLPSAAPPSAEAWQHSMVSKAMLVQVDGMKEAGELVGSMFENWDGTGHPDHLQQGQIPLRCRILRTVADFLRAVEAPDSGGIERVLPRIVGHSGTLYDPMVVVHLQGLVRESPENGAGAVSLVLPVTSLQPGMVLAEDLCTEGGIKLLARSARISAGALETILRRHRVEPILHGATVLRSSV